MTNWEDLKKELLKDKATKKEFDRLAPQYAAISKRIAAKIKLKIIITKSLP